MVLSSPFFPLPVLLKGRSTGKFPTASQPEDIACLGARTNFYFGQSSCSTFFPCERETKECRTSIMNTMVVSTRCFWTNCNA
ncbi:hypothetical protein DUNSADRAFT_7155 [Dunaliella salina]|uniref:Encoded protein n=1 Tax=Dunaliella salina TaxID=3046 RepID=A0ABQ7GLX7_DUNSA|nr:hypothetical protein DUNSADRAFT_7155 [Dunaliella salina]|eukprot:KAF5835607.1 hypothetical protein DUNSADRAFT_7155 [Dunaliella salina]